MTAKEKLQRYLETMGTFCIEIKIATPVILEYVEQIIKEGNEDEKKN